MKIGLDFGTTNSILSFWNDETQNIEVFQYNSKTYTPTAIAYKNQSVLDVGENAIDMWRNDNEEIRLYRFFKTLLSKNNDNTYDISAKDLTKDFLDVFLNKSSDSIVKNKGVIKNIVVSVPELWQKRIINTGAISLKNIFKELNLPLKNLVSEPLAAIAYFIWKNKELVKTKQKILICDMGGGTFDVALCEVKNEFIKVLSFDGNDNNKAGVFDLKEILRNLYSRANINCDENSFDFQKELWELDKQIQTDRYNEILENKYDDYLEDKDVNDNVIFKINNKPLFLSDIYEAFPPIKESIYRVLDKIKLETNNKINFDYLLFVGGFSRYFLVRRAITSYFKMKENDDRVKILPKQDSLFAVSFGASLLAAEKIKIKEYFNHSVYYYGHDKKNNLLEIPIIKIKDVINQGKPYFNKQLDRFQFRDENELILEGYVLENGITKKEFSKKVNFNFKINKKEKYELGIEINRANVAYFVLKDSNNKIDRIEIGDLFNNNQINL